MFPASHSLPARFPFPGDPKANSSREQKRSQPDCYFSPAVTQPPNPPPQHQRYRSPIPIWRAPTSPRASALPCGLLAQEHKCKLPCITSPAQQGHGAGAPIPSRTHTWRWLQHPHPPLLVLGYSAEQGLPKFGIAWREAATAVLLTHGCAQMSQLPPRTIHWEHNRWPCCTGHPCARRGLGVLRQGWAADLLSPYVPGSSQGTATVLSACTCKPAPERVPGTARSPRLQAERMGSNCWAESGWGVEGQLSCLLLGQQDRQANEPKSQSCRGQKRHPPSTQGHSRSASGTWRGGNAILWSSLQTHGTCLCAGSGVGTAVVLCLSHGWGRAEHGHRSSATAPNLVCAKLLKGPTRRGPTRPPRYSGNAWAEETPEACPLTWHRSRSHPSPYVGTIFTPCLR